MGLFIRTGLLNKSSFFPLHHGSKASASLISRAPHTLDLRRCLNTPSDQYSSSTSPEPIDGIVAVDKPKGIASTDVVCFFQRLLTRYYGNLPTEATLLPRLLLDKNYSKLSSNFKLPARRVGHGGTLDPLASGVLVIGIGNGTRSLQNFLNGDKVYSVTGRLGYTTDTLDLEGAPLPLTETQHITKDLLQECLSRFIGTITQEPPRYSAVRVDGKRLYEYARGSSTVKAGTDVEVPIRVVTATSIQLVKFWQEEARVEDRVVRLPHFELLVHCGKGFYIRSLVRDIGLALNSSAHVRELRRQVQSPFTAGSNAFAIADYLDIDFLKKTIQNNNLQLAASAKKLQK